MNSQENKKLILDHYESFVHKQDADAVRRELAPDFRDHEMPAGIPPGPDGALQFRAMLHTAFPDLQVKVEDIVAEGDRVAVRATWTGTHRGVLPMIPVPVTGRRVTFAGMVFWRLRDGKIVERWANSCNRPHRWFQARWEPRSRLLDSLAHKLAGKVRVHRVVKYDSDHR